LFIEELLEWLKTSNHSKPSNSESSQQHQYGKTNSSGDTYTRQEILRLQALYYEERRKALDLQSQVDRLQRRNEELEKLLGHDGWKLHNSRPLRRSSSNDRLRKAAQTYVPGRARYYSPPNKLG
jgi:hypothetical protein